MMFSYPTLKKQIRAGISVVNGTKDENLARKKLQRTISKLTGGKNEKRRRGDFT